MEENNTNNLNNNNLENQNEKLPTLNEKIVEKENENNLEKKKRK